MQTDTPPPSAAPMDLWARFVRVSQAVLDAAEGELKAAGFPPLAWYDVLLELRRVAPEGLRPIELRQRVLLAQYNLSRLIDRLVRAGLARRAACPEDGRGQVVFLTEKGRALLDGMWPAYREAVAKHFSDRLAPEEATALSIALDRLKPAG